MMLNHLYALSIKVQSQMQFLSNCNDLDRINTVFYPWLNSNDTQTCVTVVYMYIYVATDVRFGLLYCAVYEENK